MSVVGIFPELKLVWGFASFENYENDKYVETINDNVYSWYYDCVTVSGLFLKLHAVIGYKLLKSTKRSFSVVSVRRT